VLSEQNSEIYRTFKALIEIGEGYCQRVRFLAPFTLAYLLGLALMCAGTVAMVVA